MTIAATLALAALAALAVLGPLLSPPAAVEAASDDFETEQLRDRRSRYLQMLRDLDFDHATGKLPDAEFQRMRGALVTELSSILRQLKQAER